jgi:hypothetical protein
MFTAGDNDTYPLWYLQQVEGMRRDVVVITIPLLGANWYRDELHRRWRIADPSSVAPWRGTHDAIARIAQLATARGLPVAVDVSVLATDRNAAGSGWELQGLSYVRTSGAGLTRDVRRLRLAAQDAQAGLLLGAPTGALDYTPRYVWRLLQCPGAALADSAGGPPPPLLATSCNFR